MRVSTVLGAALCSLIAAPALSQADFSSLPKDEAMERYESVSEDAYDAMALMYTRVDPEVGDLIGSSDWDELDRETASCVYDAYAEGRELDTLGATLEAASDMADEVRADEGLHMLSIMSGERDQSAMTPDLPETTLDDNMRITRECGVLEAASRRYDNPQLMQRLMAMAGAGQ